MKRTLALIAATLLLTATVSTGIAATLKCTVTSVDQATVILDCGDKADTLKAGDAVKVKTERVSAAIEGC
ncbi:MAG: hypothetical protein H8E79_07185 [Desulfobulbaceae bacterium]|uniref:DUF5666 domain-containing protein n=1 Tax=Candidatus Desulfatifera sulfidica TaxID=2841691 RepID=A0A8J6N8L7_9BACT|nr:hypothetical protein [Candidatus Desulfatifera sulfidica]